MSNLCENNKEHKGCIKNNEVKFPHTFKFRFKSENHVVTCDVSKTVQEALSSLSQYKNISKRNKEVVIQRQKGPNGAVNRHFPCCLIEKDEILGIKLIKLDEISSGEKTRPILSSLLNSPENFVSFNIKTRGKTNVRKLMKNNLLTRSVDYVCVYALKGEKLKSALKRDGRFNRVIFQKKCAFIEQGTEDVIDMSQIVDHLDGKQFEALVCKTHPSSQLSIQESSQELSTELDTKQYECKESSDNPVSSQNNLDTCQTDLQQRPTRILKQTEPKTYPNKIQVYTIPKTSEILQRLRDQFEGLLKILKEREKRTKHADVQKIFREEYDKSACSFSEVKRVKQLVEFSNSVCQIRVGADAIGTGFLLFGAFILTNAHVIEKFLKENLLKDVIAVFGFEDLKMGKEIPVKENIVAFFHGKSDTGQDVDFALLEMSDNTKPPDCPELIHKYSAPPCRGGICIVGHPDGGIKKMDPCFIISKEQLQNEVQKHLERNFIQVITLQFFQEKFEYQGDCQISYNSCFFHGSSGSPVFDEQLNLIGVHTGGYVYPGKGGRTRSVIEYAFPMLPILVQIIRECRRNGRSDIIQYFESDKVQNMGFVLQKANEQIITYH